MEHPVPSLYRTHLDLLVGGKSHPAAEAELRGIHPPKLILPTRTTQLKVWRRPWECALPILAAALLLIVMYPTGPDSIQTKETYAAKGRPHVQAYYESDRGIYKHLPFSRLQAGDRVVASVVSPSASMMYWGVRSSAGDWLTDASFMRNTAQALQSGKTSKFPTGIQLDQENQHEVLAVFLCPENLTVSSFDSIAGSFSTFCAQFDFTLR